MQSRAHRACLFCATSASAPLSAACIVHEVRRSGRLIARIFVCFSVATPETPSAEAMQALTPQTWAVLGWGKWAIGNAAVGGEQARDRAVGNAALSDVQAGDRAAGVTVPNNAWIGGQTV